MIFVKFYLKCMYFILFALEYQSGLVFYYLLLFLFVFSSHHFDVHSFVIFLLIVVFTHHCIDVHFHLYST